MPDLDPIAFGKDMGELVRSAVQPLKDQIADLEKQLAEVNKTPGPPGEKGEDGMSGKDGADGIGISDAVLNEDGELELTFTNGTNKNLGRLVGQDGEQGADGKDGIDGKDGKDAEPVEVGQEDILDALKSDTDLMREVVREYLQDNPPPKGEKGDPGDRGPQGEPGPRGEKGVDGIGATGAMIDGEGQLIVTLGDGTLQRCGIVVGKNGSHGKDGADLSDVDFEYDGERSITVKAKGGQVVKTYEMPVIIDKGYWREGCVAGAGDSYTHDGSLWIARRTTSVRPSTQAKDDWRMAARKGRDGKPGKDGRLIEDKPIDLGVSGDE